MHAFGLELDCAQMRYEQDANAQINDAYDVSLQKQKSDVVCQTELQGVISRNIDVIVVYDKPVNIQNTRPNACDQGM